MQLAAEVQLSTGKLCDHKRATPVGNSGNHNAIPLSQDALYLSPSDRDKFGSTALNCFNLLSAEMSQMLRPHLVFFTENA